ncbi:selenium metabolism-associated LysR family transcriptional regulator [Bacillus solimangrovi]|uniref:HTH lysR-type domain-containing protein n=1 Tax=Bacillus solimangrovi TaxID=1305675 RepID=A0A1E5LJT7_9BACI|nr:selenium metabolism-associated LysR family transcriptional regulator [Bacillus solimangrovi]OEH94331.1 hypothetical protein BFG57_08735 [Bacillus solimangrovi]
MNQRQLSIFISTAETKSMTKTAHDLYMTQPAVSQTISDLEQQLNVQLFDRFKRQLHLTDAGDTLYDYAKRIIALTDEAKTTMQEYEIGTKGKLQIGASTTIGIYLLPQLAASFRSKNEQIHLNYTINNTRVIEDLILKHELDIGIVEGTVHSKDIIETHMMDDELFLICSHLHEWATKEPDAIETTDLQNESIIAREKGSGTREVVEQVLSLHKITLNNTHTLNNTEAIKKAVEANLGVTFLSKLAIQDELSDKRIIHVPLKQISFPRTLKIIYHKDKYMTPLFQSFLNHCQQFALQ